MLLLPIFGDQVKIRGIKELGKRAFSVRNFQRKIYKSFLSRNSMKKRGQITIFIVIAVIIIAAIVLLTIFRPAVFRPRVSAEEAQKIVSAQVLPVSDFVADCLEGPYKESLVKIGYQGGYCSPVPVSYNQLGNYSVPYLVKESKNNLLLLEGEGATISKEIERCVDMEEVIECINDFKAFEKLIDVKERGDLTFRTQFVPPLKIVVSIDYPLGLSRGEAKTEIQEMGFEVRSGLYSAYLAAADITSSELEEGDFDIDSYVRENPFITLDRQGVPGTVYYYLTTVPLEDEKEYDFHFGVER